MLEAVEAAAKSAAPAPLQFLNRLKPPRWLFRTAACLILGGQVVGRISRGETEVLQVGACIDTCAHLLHSSATVWI